MEIRRAGVLAHVSSLPGPFGIGDLGPASLRFVDWSAEAGLGLWQVLPLHPTGFGGSPYSALSAFAGNPLLLSPQALVTEGWLAAAELDSGTYAPGAAVDFLAAGRWKSALLRRAGERFERQAARQQRDDLAAFVEAPARRAWLEDWCRFAALRLRLGGAPWIEWPAELRRREPAALRRVDGELAGEIGHQRWLQFVFFRQWAAVRRAAAARGIEILGDVPFYMAHDSADVWARPDLFQLDDAGQPSKVAGVPPDYFSASGQLWGNPLYDWPRLAAQGYDWWVERLVAELELADRVRLDHFRAFAAYWEVPASATDAVSGQWQPGPGRALFRVLHERLGALPFVAEDLGLITEDVHALRRELGLPGMAVLQFAFDEENSDYLPERHTPDLVVYTGTHDNDTTRGWFQALPPARRRRVLEALGTSSRGLVRDLIAAAYGSAAERAVVPLQDLFELGSDARMNVPGRAEGNWTWRASARRFTAQRAAWLRGLAARNGRLAAVLPAATPRDAARR